MQGALDNPIKCRSQCKQFKSYNLLLDILKTINDIPLECLSNVLSRTWKHCASRTLHLEANVSILGKVSVSQR